MKKTILFVLALAILAIALPAQARPANGGARDHRRENDHPRQYRQEYRQRGYSQPVFGPTFLGLLHQNQMMTTNMVYGIFNPQPAYTQSYYGVSRRSPEEELARCVGRILKDARKNHQLTTVEQAGSICTGQPIPSIAAPEPAPVAPQPQKVLTPALNRAGERVCVNGLTHEAGQTFEVDPASSPKVRTIKGGTCGEAGFVWANHQTTLDLVCIRKVR